MRFFKKAVNNHCFEGNPCSLFARPSWIGAPHTGAPVWGGLRLPQAPPDSGLLTLGPQCTEIMTSGNFVLKLGFPSGVLTLGPQCEEP